jgi:hypothetical protein
MPPSDKVGARGKQSSSVGHQEEFLGNRVAATRWAVCPVNLLKLTYCLRHQEPSEMILFLLLQRRVLFQGWLHCGFSPWFPKIPFETCCDIRF